GDAPLLVEDDGAAVEDELVVAADEVEVRDRHAAVLREAREHPPPHTRLALGERRGGDVQEQGGPAADRLLARVLAVDAAAAPEVLVVPEVLADREAEALAEHRHQRRPG